MKKKDFAAFIEKMSKVFNNEWLGNITPEEAISKLMSIVAKEAKKLK